MTCIVGIVEEEKAYIGADSCAWDGLVRRASQLEKVFRNGRFVIGYTSSFRMGQLLQYRLQVQAQNGEGDLEYMVCQFAEAVRSCLKDYGYARVDSNEESGGAFLVAYKGKLYQVASDFQVNFYRDGLAVVGSGTAFAYGALFALRHLKPRARIERALEAAAYCNPYVMPPFTILESSYSGDK